MKNLKAGAFSYGRDIEELFDNTLGKCNKNLDYNSVDLKSFGHEGLAAWFIYMDGHEHGPTQYYKVKTHTHENGNIIHEHFICKNKKILLYYRKKDGCWPFRLVFKLDPYEEKNNGKCKFYGLYVFSKFINEKLTRVEYKRVATDFVLGTPNSNDVGLLTQNDLIDFIPNYYYPIAGMNYPDKVYDYLRDQGIFYAGQLLLFKTKAKDRMAIAIQKEFFNIFGRTGEFINEDKVDEIVKERQEELNSLLILKKNPNFVYDIFNPTTNKHLQLYIDSKSGLFKFGNEKENKWNQLYFNNQNEKTFIYFVEYVFKNFNKYCY